MLKNQPENNIFLDFLMYKSIYLPIFLTKNFILNFLANRMAKCSQMFQNKNILHIKEKECVLYILGYLVFYFNSP